MTAKWISILISALAVITAATGSQAQSPYPSQTVKFIVPYAAGGLPDNVAHLFAKHLEAPLGQPIVIENRGGANGSLAVGTLLNTATDGYTLIVSDGTIFSANPVMYKNLTYSEKDLKPVAFLARAPLFLASHPKNGAKTLSEFVAYVRANPGKINYGSSGVGSTHHLSMIAFAQALGLDMVHVPFKGTGESVPALLGGHVEALFSAFPSLSGAAEGKQISLLAANSAERSSFAPSLPAISETISGYDFATIVGIFGRSDVPAEVVTKWSSLAAQAGKNSDLAKSLAVVGIDIVGASADEFQTALQSETGRLRDVIKSSGLTAR